MTSTDMTCSVAVSDGLPYGYIYRITNLVNGKTYVGQRRLSLDSSWRGYLGSGTLILATVRKHGQDRFAKSFLSYASNQTELDELEIAYIALDRADGKGQYNITDGGRGTRCADIGERIRLGRLKNDSRKHKLDPAVLFDLYWTKRKSSIEIARILGVPSGSTITVGMQKLGIPRRDRQSANALAGSKHSKTLAVGLDASTLARLYSDEQLSISAIAKQYSLSTAAVYHRLIAAKVPVRTRSEASAISWSAGTRARTPSSELTSNSWDRELR